MTIKNTLNHTAKVWNTRKRQQFKMKKWYSKPFKLWNTNNNQKKQFKKQIEGETEGGQGGVY